MPRHKAPHAPSHKIEGTPEYRKQTVRFQISLPEELYDAYTQQGISAGRSVEEEIEHRLRRCQDHVSQTPLYFNDDERRQLSECLGHNCVNAAIVLQQIKHAVQLKVDDVTVELPPRLQQRIRSRVFRGSTYEQVLKREVIHGLSVFAGLLPS